MKQTQLVIERTWDGLAVADDERVSLELTLSRTHLNVGIEAPFHNDPAPPEAAGSLHGLWEFEVVELFLRGTGDSYLELEFGPYGHYLALRFDGYRRLRESGLAIAFEAHRSAKRWNGRARIPDSDLPSELRSCNAYAIHGSGPARRYLALYPSAGDEPDFHKLDSFGALDW